LTASARDGARNLRSGRKKACGAVEQKKDAGPHPAGDCQPGRSPTSPGDCTIFARIPTAVHIECREAVETPPDFPNRDSNRF
jgi:hypothetical protein